MRSHLLLILCLSPAGFATAQVAPPTWASLERRVERIRPTAAETRWMRIPWVRSVAEGQRIARAENRPIMFWNVDYDPLERC